jgi:hypothetical protein
MERDIALRIDAMLMGVIASLNAVASYMKNNLSDDEARPLIRYIGSSMGQAILISNVLHDAYPDIVPKELK